MTTRRTLLIAFSASALGVSLASLAQQQSKVWRVGFLSPRARPASIDSDFFGGFPRAMRELGYVEGKNLVMEWRFAGGKFERLPELAAELVALKVDVVVAASTAAVLAMQKATTTLPIIMITVDDPVRDGLVKSLARPGGNITGFGILASELGPKLLEMLLSVVPKASRVAVLMNPANTVSTLLLKNIQAAAPKTNTRIIPTEARTPQEIENAFSTMVREHAEAVIVARDSIFTQQNRQIAELAIKHRLPSISGNQVYAQAGGLIGYGSNLADDIQRPAIYADKIFKGAKPAELPVELPTKFELVVNGKTAKVLGITIPPTLMISVTKVIE